jgi:hypothetical protein
LIRPRRRKYQKKQDLAAFIPAFCIRSE